MHVIASRLQRSQQPGITFYFVLGKLHPETSHSAFPITTVYWRFTALDPLPLPKTRPSTCERTAFRKMDRTGLLLSRFLLFPRVSF